MADDEDDGKGAAQAESAEAGPTCARLHDFQSLVERANFEFEKEKLEGHIRSNSLVFNTFIFLQVTLVTCIDCCTQGCNQWTAQHIAQGIKSLG